MGGYTSKHERNSTKRRIKGNSTRRRELDEKETEWRKERKSLREEIKRLRMKMDEKEEAKEDQNHEWEWVVEQMCLERAVREEAVERWKHLYFAIKNELDDLIHTAYGEALREKPKKDVGKSVQELNKEVKVREETIEKLKERIALMEKKQNGTEREIDLLRQSLRILGSSSNIRKNKAFATKNLPISKTKFSGCK